MVASLLDCVEKKIALEPVCAIHAIVDVHCSARPVVGNVVDQTRGRRQALAKRAGLHAVDARVVDVVVLHRVCKRKRGLRGVDPIRLSHKRNRRVARPLKLVAQHQRLHVRGGGVRCVLRWL